MILSVIIFFSASKINVEQLTISSKAKGITEHFYGEGNNNLIEKYVTKEKIIYKPSYHNFSVIIDEYLIDKVSGRGMIRYKIKKEDFRGEEQEYLKVSNSDLITYKEDIDETSDKNYVYVYYSFILSREEKRDVCSIGYYSENEEKVNLQFADLDKMSFQTKDNYDVNVSPIGMTIGYKTSTDINEKKSSSTLSYGTDEIINKIINAKKFKSICRSVVEIGINNENEDEENGKRNVVKTCIFLKPIQIEM